MENRNKKNRLTINDVAREAGVSVSTVSSVINKSRFVAEEKEIKVREAISKLNYKINPIARGLRKKSLRAVGVVVPDISEVFYSQVIAGMEEVARKRNYTLILCCTFYNTEEENRQIDILLDKSVDGIIFFSGSNNPEIIKKVKEYGTPLVLTDREINIKSILSVLVDNESAMENVVDYLVKNGHRRIAYITMQYNNQTTVKNRYLGYCNGLKRHGIELDEKLILLDDEMIFNPMGSAYNLVDNLLKEGPIPTAFIVIADFLAVGAMKAIRNNGFQIPQDISIVGFNNDSICDYLYPPLTSVKQPKKLMGNTAMNLLLDSIEGKRVANKKILLPVKIIERDSVIKI